MKKSELVTRIHPFTNHYFIRVSRSAIVNKNYIAECRRHFKGNYILVLNDTLISKIQTGNAYLDQLKEVLEF